MFRRLIDLFRKPAASEPEIVPESAPSKPPELLVREVKYKIGQVVHHRVYPFRGVIFDVDPVFANSEKWYQSIPEDVRPHRDQPYYHIFAENSESHYTAYVSEQNLVLDNTDEPLQNPDIEEVFILGENGQYRLRETYTN